MRLVVIAGESMTRWSPGDRVIHTGKPEWGVGAIEIASAAVENGAPCQRLRVRFDRVGSKTLSTAFATLKAADGPPEKQDMDVTEQGDSWLTALEAKPITERLVEITE
jgi:hypothetical protein